MKKLFLALTLTAAFLWAQGTTIVGQKTVQISAPTWTSASNTGKTRIKIVAPDSVNHRVWLDTSSTGQAGQWKRIDNTADSCTVPFVIASDSNGSTRPVWEYRLWMLTKAVDADSSTFTFRVQTRERFYNATTAAIAWSPWTVKGANNGYADVTVQDSVLVGNIRHSGSKFSQYSLFHVTGSQARLCPDNVPGTGKAIGDSVIVDSLRVFLR